MTPRALLRTLAPGFLPLLAYIAVETLFGETAGLAAGIALGAAEFILILVRQGKADPFVAGDTILLAILGAASLAFRSPVLFRLKPSIAEGVLAAVLAGLLAAPGVILEGWLRRQLGALAPSGQALARARKSLAGMAVLLALHAALSAFAAFFLPVAWWGFISGGLLYILMAILALSPLVLAQFARARVPIEWRLILADGKGSVFCTRRGGDPAAPWGFPASGRAMARGRPTGRDAIPAEIAAAVAEALEAILDPRSRGEIRVGSVAGASPLVLVAIIHPEGVRKGRDPSSARFWSLSDLASKGREGGLDPDFRAALDSLVRASAGPDQGATLPRPGARL